MTSVRVNRPAQPPIESVTITLSEKDAIYLTALLGSFGSEMKLSGYDCLFSHLSSALGLDSIEPGERNENYRKELSHAQNAIRERARIGHRT